MRIAATLTIAAISLLGGCHQGAQSFDAAGRSQGRYAGVGTYDAGRVWAQMRQPDQADSATAKLADDEHIIVVLDSHTGEVRQCGDHSGVCVTMNP